MGRHARASAPALHLHHPASPPTHNYIHNTNYGLLEPLPSISVSRSHPPRIPHHRTTSSGNIVWEFDFADIKEKSIEIRTGIGEFGERIGEKIGEKVPGVRYSAGQYTFFYSIRPYRNRFCFFPMVLAGILGYLNPWQKEVSNIEHGAI